MVSRDQLWKSILEDLFEPCIYFFYPEEAQTIDWTRSPEFLDKELAKLHPKSAAKGRIADKLVRLWLLSGAERWLLIHIEVQGYVDDEFAFRMYQYRIRIRERYGKDVVAMAILTDEDPGFRPNEYRESVWDNVLSYAFRSYKVLENPPDEYADKDNPFAIILETAYYGISQNKLSDEYLLEMKKRLMRNLLRKGFERQRVLNVLHFIDEYVHFENSKFQRTFETEIDRQLKIQKTMSTYELVLRARRAEARQLRKQAKIEGREEGRQEGREEGREEGRQEGRQEGREEGRMQTLRFVVEQMLREGLAPEFIAKMLQINVAEVNKIAAAIQPLH